MAGVTEFPVILVDAEVRALLSGRPTTIVRPAKLPDDAGRIVVDPGGTVFGPGPYLKVYHQDPSIDPACYPRIYSPLGYPGDKLWIREAWRSWRWTCERNGHDHDDPCDEHCDQTYVAYRATPREGYRPVPDRQHVTYLDASTPLDSNPNLLGPWKSPAIMPHWASRLTVEVTETTYDEENRAWHVKAKRHQ